MTTEPMSGIVLAVTACIPYPGYPSIVQPVDVLTAPDQGETDTTPAAEAVYWLRHPEIAAATVNTLTAVLDKWESDPEWSGPPAAPEEPECQE